MSAIDKKPVVAVLVEAVITIVSAGPALAQGTPGYDHMMWNGGWGHWIFGPLMMLLFLGILVFGVAAAIRWIGGDGRPGQSTSNSSARAILEERYARGEIDEKEFRERKRTLED